MKKLTIVWLLCFTCIEAFSQWEQIHPQRPFQRTFTVAGAMSGQKYYAVGAELAVSPDTGNQWQQQTAFHPPVPLLPDAQFQDFFFCNEQTAFLLDKHKIFKTTDGGTSWEVKAELGRSHPQQATSAYFLSAHFIDEAHGYAVGPFKKIFRTEDGGDTWDTLSWNNKTAPYTSYTDVFFINDSLGFVSGYEVPDLLMNFGFTHFVMKTTDGGTTWSRSDIPVSFDYRKVFIQVMDEDTIFAWLSNTQAVEKTFRSTDGGNTWTENSPALQDIKTIEWINGSTGLAFGSTGLNEHKLVRTEDSGEHWEVVELPFDANVDENSITDIAFSNDKNGIAVGCGGLLMNTNDQGKTWQLRNGFFPLIFTMDFSSEETGYASTGKGFYKTTDGGNSWQFREGSDSLRIYKIEMDKEDNGFFYGYRNYNYRVSNGGMQIDSMKFPLYFVFSSYIISRGDSLFVAGVTLNPFKLSFLRSGDQGTNWEVVTVQDGNHSVVSFHDGGNGTLYMGTSSHFKRSDNGGATWQDLYAFAPDYFYQSCSLAKDTFLAITSNEKVLRSTDGGISWNAVTALPANAHFADFLQVDNLLVYMYGYITEGAFSKAAIWKSVDAGASWTEEELPDGLDRSVNAMSISGSMVYATSGYGQIIRYELPEVVTTTTVASEREIRLYPVPSESLLQCKLPEHTGSIEINILTLNAERFTIPYIHDAGNITIDTSLLPSGIHIMEITTKDGIYRKAFLKK